MTAVVQALARFSAASNFEIDVLKVLAVFSGLGLVVSLVCAMHGLDLGAELF